MHRRMTAGIFLGKVGSGEVGHLAHLGYSRRGMGLGVDQPGKRDFLCQDNPTAKQALPMPHSNLLLMNILVLFNDVSPNPGPVQCLCLVCGREVAASHKATQCDVCKTWCHIGPKCENVPARI